ncbi:transcription factor/nuclear export subunit protein 2-domain-containing protein [Ephemerocybe angulata]|uniref:THO complex subunit 2 n=1 Tax=Ephemerocybe angulata TaxID=980116 RepID=A0A8H6IE61_9AGAR|nr:transcription factor/nuclear export subunit protein 2-domain-containing protein [Tulosesus angulatus]
MDVVERVRSYLAIWGKGGEAECRNFLFAPHCAPLDPANLHILTTAYHTLLSALLTSLSPGQSLPVQAFPDFVRSVLNTLPSSSSNSSSSPDAATIFGDHLVDIIWTVDALLEVPVESYNALYKQANPKSPAVPTAEALAHLATATKSYQTAVADKERLATVIKKLLEYGVIDVTACRERLETPMLISAGLVPNTTAFGRKEVRVRTGLFYKQNKFNLLREQSEGYSKLTTEITSSLGPPHSPQTGLPTESPSVLESRVRPVWEKVVSLIGHFDLDPNRVADIILDMLSTHLLTHHSFFLALLSYSPWGPNEQSSKEKSTPVDPKPESYLGMSLDEILSSCEKPARSADTKNRDGSRVLAQLLGFKFAFHNSTATNEPAPRSLYLTTALLIREGFVSLEEVYPHLSLPDEEMETVRTEYLANISGRISGAGMSLLAMAAPLESGPSHSKHKASAPADDKKPEKKETKSNQKVGLLTALLAVGALRPALSILTRFPWLVDPHPEIADLLLQMLRHSISVLYEAQCNFFSKDIGFTQPRARYGAGGVLQPSPRKTVLTLLSPAPLCTSTTDFVFFYPRWSEQVPTVNSLEEIESVVEPFLQFIGPHLSRDTAFLTRLVRLGRNVITPPNPDRKAPSEVSPSDHPNYAFWYRILRQYIFPALPLIRGNAVCTVEIWHLIRIFEPTSRWQLYGEWKSMYMENPELRVRQVQAEKESKDILRRLSHQTIDSLSGAVGKLAHSNPMIFFTNVVNQVMAYENLASVIVQALRYVTNMGFDVLVFVILDTLSDDKKDRLKTDGVNIADWLQSLAGFTGMLFRRYNTDLKPVLKYVVNRLQADVTSDITILKELIWKMAGIEPLPSLSNAQIAAMAGGKTLRIQTIAAQHRGAQADPSDLAMRAPDRLADALINSGLALPLLVQVAQQRQSCVFNASKDSPLKTVSGLFDATHGVFLQYLDLLTTVVKAEDYANKVLPAFEDLANKYGIEPSMCMQIIRPVLHHKLVSKAVELQNQEERIANEEAEKRLKAALTAKREPTASVSDLATPGAATSGSSDTPNAAPSTEGTQDAAPMEVDTSTTDVVPTPASPWVPELEELFDAVRKIAPTNAIEVIGPAFYLTFWQLSNYDLAPPNAYDAESNLLRILSREEDQKFTMADRSADKAKRATAGQHKAKRDRYNEYISLLSREYKEQTTARAFTIKRLAKEKTAWFAHLPKSANLIHAIIEHCIQPRSLLSPMDADYCAKIIRVLHLQGTPGFHTLKCYDKLLSDHVKVVVFTCTDYEARNYGRFLLGIMTDLHKWHTDERAYTQDNRVNVAGRMVHLPGLQRALTNASPSQVDILTWKSFQGFLKKTHKKIADSFIECIKTGEFMRVYNAIVVLKEILPVFPRSDCTTKGPELQAAVENLIATEQRSDLKILARAYAAGLAKLENLWSTGPRLTVPALASSNSNSPAPERPPRVANPPPTKPSAQQNNSSDDQRRDAPQQQQPPASAPSGPRAAQQNGASFSNAPSKPNTIQSTKSAMESIPRPEVVKRVRTDNRNNDASPRPPLDAPKPSAPFNPQAAPFNPSNAPEVRPIPVMISGSRGGDRDQRDVRSDGQQQYPPRHPPHQPPYGLPNNPLKERKEEHQHPMLPPAIPSQTLSAVELRETARQSIQHNRNGASGDRDRDAPSPRVRSPSPTAPASRDLSPDSRGSGGRMRSDRMLEGSAVDERGRERDLSLASRDGGSGANATRRDSLTHTRERDSRTNRDRTSERDRDGERGRDRHGDRERDRGDRDGRDRERGDRDRDGRDRERSERERGDRDRDRHRRDDKDRERDRKGGVPGAALESPLPTRPEPSRRDRTERFLLGEESIGVKRRRGADDDSDRALKRSSRKDRERRIAIDDIGERIPRTIDRASDRANERRRRLEEAAEAERKSRESRGSSAEKVSEKRPGDDRNESQRGDSQRAEGGSGSQRASDNRSNDNRGRQIQPGQIPTQIGPMTDIFAATSIPESLRNKPPTNPPNAPRAMKVTPEQLAKERSRKEAAKAASGAGGGPGGSLRSRISDNLEGGGANTGSGGGSGGNAAPSSSGPLPSAGSSEATAFRGGGTGPVRDSSVPGTRYDSEDRDGSRKRTVSEREKEGGDSNAPPSSAESSQPVKRPKINRNRLNSSGPGSSAQNHGIARKLLPIDHHGSENRGQRRHD